MNDQRPVNIVMIEDDEGHARLIEKNIRRAGINNEICHFTNGGDALDYLMNHNDGPKLNGPALVLLDLNLPGSTGWELLRTSRLARPDAPPVVIASAVTVDHRRLASFAVAGYLPKPFPLETLLATIERVLASRTAAREVVD